MRSKSIDKEEKSKQKLIEMRNENKNLEAEASQIEME